MESTRDVSPPHGPTKAGLVRRPAFWLVSGFSALYFAGSCTLAARAPLWYDELFTFHLARLARWTDLWPALASGTDCNPPLCYLLTRLSRLAFGEGPLAERLPGLLGFWVMSLCLYRFVARRCTPLYAFLAMLLPLATAVFPAAYDARPYGLVLGCCGASLVCWQDAAERCRRWFALAGLAASLAAAFLSHYYAVLLLVPLVAGELVRSASRRRLDWPVWLALGAGAVPLGFLLPLAEQTRVYAAASGLVPDWDALGPTYGFLLKDLKWPLLAALGLAALYPERPAAGTNPRAAAPRPAPPAHEIAAALGLIALPAVGFALGRWVTGIFVARYAAAAVLGFSLLAAFVAHRRTRGSLLVAAALVVAVMGRFVLVELHEFKQLARAKARLLRTFAFLEKNDDGRSPVVVTDAFDFLQLAHYAPPALAPRLVYLSNADPSGPHPCRDPKDAALHRLRDWAPLQVADYGPFLAAHRTFLVYGDAGPLRPALEGDGVRFEVQGVDQQTVLFRCTSGSGTAKPDRPGGH
jgi:hypothetical protein